MIFRKKTVHFHVWNYEVIVVVTDDFNAAFLRLGLEAVDEPPSATSTTGGISCHDKQQGRSYLFIEDKTIVSAVAHESWHCIRRMFLWAGVVDFDSETVAYHLGYLSGKVHEFAHREVTSDLPTVNNVVG